MTFERILSHFQVRKRGTGKAQCICPAHADREASLTLTDGNDRALIIDYINNVIRVNKTVSWKEGGGIEETLPKSDTSNRDIPMNDTIKKILQMQKTKISMVYGEIHARKMDSNIFIGSNGAKAIASSTVSSAIDNVLKRLRQQGIEIERFTHHAFRDTFATRYIEEGGNMQTLQKILGHSSLAMTADLYAHVLPNTKQQEMQQIENGFIGVAVL